MFWRIKTTKLPAILFVLIFFALLYESKGQASQIEKYKDSVRLAKSDSDKAHALYILSYYYQMYKPDSSLLLAESAYELSKQAKYLKGEAAALGQIAGAFNRLGNFPKALQFYLEQLKILEKKEDPEDIASVFLSIALVYNSQKDAPDALYYAFKADSIARVNKLETVSLYTTLDIGDIYFNNNQFDSALQYTKRCYDQSLRLKQSLITGTALNNMGNIYFRSGNISEALNSYKNSIPYLLSMQDDNTLAECYLGLARSFDKLEMRDSAMFYANASFKIATANSFLKHQLNASAFLVQLYKQQNKVDSAFAYQEKYVALKDSFDNSEKVKQLQNLTLSEQLRQQQIAEQKIQLAKERRTKLELLLIGIFIPLLFFTSAIISRKKVHHRIIKISGIISLLFLFEYIILLINPIVSEKTGNSPVFEIIIFVLIAAILSPTHHKFEHWLMSKLTHKHGNTTPNKKPLREE